MIIIKNLFLKIIAVPDFTDEEDARRRYILNIVLLMAIAATVFVFLGLLVTDLVSVEALDRATQSVYFLCIIAIVCFSVLYVINRYFSGILAAVLFVIFLLLIISFADTPAQVASGRSLIAYTVPIIFAGMVLKPTLSYVAAGVASIIITIINVGVLHQPMPNIPAIAIFFMVALVSHISSSSLIKALENMALANKKIQERESQFRSVFNGVNDAILVETTEGKVLDVNARACKMFGWTYDEFLTKTLQDMVPPENRALSAEARDEDDLTVEHFETINMRANGERFPVSVTGRIEEIGSEKRLLIAVRDITEQKKAKEELLKLSRAITQSPAAIVITDLKGTIEFVNPAFTRITGYTTEEALGQNPSILQSGEHGSEFYKVLWETISAGKTWSGEFRNKSKTGEFFWESASISPVANAEGDIKNYVAVKEDITLRKQAMADLEKAKEAAEAAAQAKTDFLANMSHEIRTPLNAIYGMTSLMQDTPLNDEQQDFIKTIRDGSDTLLSVINDILDFSKIEAGKMELEEHPFRVRGCIEDTLDLLAEKAAKKMLELAYIIEDDVPPMVIGDVTRLRQILVNLLNNALKFTDKGEVVVLLKSMLLEKNQYELQFSIRDTGIGIPKDKMGRLFKSFSQVDTSTTRKYGGTGLGLAISKELAEKMGGRMWVESEEGKGSTFHFTVIAKAEKTAPLISIDQYSDFSGKRILIVDDNATNRLILIKQTESWGMKPTAVESGKEALALFDKETFDIAILDMQMPEMDGFTLSERISEMNTKNNLPMIILTSIKRDKTRATDSRIAAFLNKPIKTSNLFNVLNSIISSASAVKTKKTKKENAMDSTVAVRHPLRVLLVEDNIINQKVAAKILSRLGYQSDIASNGFEAIEALERQPYDVVFMDIQMPEMDGNEATKRIRDRWPKDHQPYIIAMTAHALEGDREKYIARGMDDYVSKPIKVDALIAALENVPRVD